LTWVALVLFLTSIGAVAQTKHYTATLAQPLTAPKSLIANGNAWRCEGSTCVLDSEPKDAPSVRSCHQLRLAVGELTTYGTPDKPLDADTLAKCNSKN
jgi:hypothetical protein